jgi:hypothetical protein
MNKVHFNYLKIKVKKLLLNYGLFFYVHFCMRMLGSVI